MKDNASLRMVGSVLTVSAFLYLVVVMQMKAITMNPATWIMWSVLDIFIAYSMVRGNNSSAPTMIAFTIGAIVIAAFTLVQLSQGKTTWSFGFAELVPTAGFIAAFTARLLTKNTDHAINYGTTAMLVAGLPSLADAIRTPHAMDPWFWGLCAIGCILTLLGSPEGFTSRYMPVGGAILNGSIALFGVMGVIN